MPKRLNRGALLVKKLKELTSHKFQDLMFSSILTVTCFAVTPHKFSKCTSNII